MPTVAVLDYGSGNLRSVVRAVERAGADVVLTADATVAEQAAGLVVPGVGAFEAKSLISAMGGRLAVESKPGDGSNFTITLPAAEPAAETQRKSA